MKRYLEIIIGLLLLSLMIIAGSLFLNSRSPRPNAIQTITAPSGQGIDILQARLEQLGVPIQEIKTVSSPYDIEITVQMLHGDTHTSPDDQWNLFLASREATLAYLCGFPVSSFTLLFVKTDGKVVDTGKTFLYPNQFSQQLTGAKPSGTDNAATKDLIEKKLPLKQFRIVSLQITSGEIVRENTKFVDLILEYPAGRSATNIESDINLLINHLVPSVKDIETREQPNISLVRIRITNDAGNFILHYIYDFDTFTQSWSLADGLEGCWYSKSMPPALPPSTPSIQITPTSSISGYPPPKSIPTPSAAPRSYP